MMKRFTGYIPNLLTLGNLVCGTAGTIAVFRYNIFVAAAFIWLGSVFDFLDGFAARALKARSDTGRELDSLADMVTFGILPSLILFEFLSGIVRGNPYIPYISLITVIFSALRLARFNIDESQKKSFTGLPTPANAFLLSGFPFLSQAPGLGFVRSAEFLVPAIVISSLLMVTPAKFLSLKFNDMKDPDNKFRYLVMLAAFIIIVLMEARGVSLAVVAYMIISFAWDRMNRGRQTPGGNQSTVAGT